MAGLRGDQNDDQRELRSQQLPVLGSVINTAGGATTGLVNTVGNTLNSALTGLGNTVGGLLNGVANTINDLATLNGGPTVLPTIPPLTIPPLTIPPLTVPPLTPKPAAPVVPVSPVSPVTNAPPPATAAPVVKPPIVAPPPSNSVSTPATNAPVSTPATNTPVSPSATKAPASTVATDAPTSPQTTSPSSTTPPPTDSSKPMDAPAATPTPTHSVAQTTLSPVTVDTLDVGGKSHPFVSDNSDVKSTDPDANTPKFVSTTSDGTNHDNSKSLSSGPPGSSSASRDKDSSGASSVRTITGVGVSFGISATIVLVVAMIMYVRRQRSKIQGQYKSDTFDPAELDTHRSDLDTYGTSYMTGNLTARYAGSTSAWDDEELMVVRVPLESIVKDELISSGAFGEVYRGRFQDQDIAIKTLLPAKRKEMEEIKAFQAEIKLMAGLEHPRVVRFVGVAWESLAELCVVTEFMAGGDLTSLLASFDATGRPQGFDIDKVKIALHVAHGLTYLHSLPVIHRDLKSKNVLLDAEWNAKITDFGVSRERADETMTTGVGSSLWMAPEVILGERYDEKADMFSFGVLLSEIDTQLRPYAHARLEGQTEHLPPTTVLQLVSLGVMTIKLTETVFFEDMRALARQCVELDPKDRPTAGEALHRIHIAYTNALDDQSVML